MPRLLADVRPSFVVRVAGEVDGLGVTDIAIDGLSIEVPGRNLAGENVVHSYDILEGVDTYDANIIRFLENLQAAMEEEVTFFLKHPREVSNGPTS